jgi:pimeloyl-ACP methyl ester carboxylesterase
VGSGPYEPQYVKYIQQTRLNRLNESERAEYKAIIAILNTPKADGKAQRFARLGQLAAKTDQYDPVQISPQITKKAPGERDANSGNKFHTVLKEVQEMRQDGSLLKFAEQIQSPVVAIHGDYDPHPIAGVHEPLTDKLINFRMIVLEHCGHKPWIERRAKKKFFKILTRELLAT